MAMAIKQKINTKSSTKAELVGVDDAMSFVEWVQLFVGEQLRSINNDSVLKKIGSEIVIQQDNTRTIQLARNGNHDEILKTLASGARKPITSKYSNTTAQLGSYHRASLIHSNQLNINHSLAKIAYE